MDDTHVQEKPRRHVLANSVNTDVIKCTFQESVSSDCFSCFQEQSHIKNNVEYLINSYNLSVAWNGEFDGLHMLKRKCNFQTH